MARCSALLCVAGLLLSTASATDVDIWAFNIANGPAPSPEDGPPLSRNASRDPRILPWQILGIVGGYVLTVVIIFSLLLTVGKRLRLAAQSSASPVAQEMVKKSRWVVDPTSKGQSSNAKSWGKLSRKKSIADSKGPSVATVAHFDDDVIRSHKQQQELEMEKLYAAVMSGNTKSPKEVSAAKFPSGSVDGHTRTLSNSSRSFSQRIPPQQRERGFSDASYKDSTTPTSTANPGNPVYAVYPPYGPMPSDPSAPTFSPYGNQYPRQQTTSSRERPQTSRTVSDHQRQVSKGHQRQVSSESNKSRNRSIRHMTISAPMPSAGIYEDEDDAREPLSPRRGIPPPPSPPHQGREIRQDEDADDSDIIDSYGYEAMEAPKPLPRAAPQRAPKLVLPKHHNNGSNPYSKSMSPTAGASSSTLPLRAYTPAPATASSSRHDLSQPLPSPGPTKMTLLSPRKDKFYAPGTGRNTLTAGLATPYSPYMPATPMTPVTPHLIGRAERRQRTREEGRRVITEEDEVQDEKDMWGDAY